MDICLRIAVQSIPELCPKPVPCVALPVSRQVIDLSQYSPTFFGPEHAQVLSNHLIHSSLPGLTSMEQMSLMALADTIATTSTDLRDSQNRKGTAAAEPVACSLCRRASLFYQSLF